jgi:hypothetical protein
MKIDFFKYRYFCSTSCTARDVLISLNMEVVEEEENLFEQENLSSCSRRTNVHITI